MTRQEETWTVMHAYRCRLLPRAGMVDVQMYDVCDDGTYGWHDLAVIWPASNETEYEWDYYDEERVEHRVAVQDAWELVLEDLVQ